jgi:riboflavin kinase/FMN adenylyltransferase
MVSGLWQSLNSVGKSYNQRSLSRQIEKQTMQLTWFPDVSPHPRKVAIGTFDGLHLGHRAVIEGNDTVLTFEPHPVSIIHPSAAPKLLTPLEIKADLLAELGVDELVVIPFDQEFSKRSAQQFIDEVLIDSLRATSVSVGENFRFGHKAKGNVELLTGQQAFDTRVVPLIEVEGETVSSSHIRGLVLAGEVELAAHFLGAPFQMRGTVLRGDGRGKKLGYPTANLVGSDALVHPGHGVYAGLANDQPAAISIGVRPTFTTGRGELIEAYLIDFDGDLYGKQLTLKFLERLRGEKAFTSAAQLVEQMHEDVAQARLICEHFAKVDS